MPSTYSQLLRIELQASGENDTTWGTKTNNNFTNVIEAAIAGLSVITMIDQDYTLSVSSGAVDEARSAILVVQGVITAQRAIIVPALSKIYVIKNECGYPVSVTTATGTGTSVQSGTTGIVFCDGNNVNNALSPTSDGSITPTKIDTAVASAWQFGGALGVGRAQAYTPGYGVVGIDGTSGSRTTYYVSGASKGEINATAGTFDLAAAPNSSLTLSTNSATRLSISSSGSVAIDGPVTLGSTLAGVSMSMNSNGNFGGTVTANGGFVGITAANVSGALGYSPVQQGTGANQSPSYAVKIGWNPSASKLRAQVNTTDLGNFMFENTAGIFIRQQNDAGLFTFASNTPGVSYVNCVQFREVNYSGSNNLDPNYAPGFAFHWGNVIASQVRLSSNGSFWFNVGDGVNRCDIVAQNGQFYGTVAQGLSDMRLKDRIGGIINARSMIKGLDCFYYRNNAIARSNGVTDEGVQIGLSAQQVEAVLPALVSLAPFDRAPVPCKNGEWTSKSGNNYRTVDYPRMVPVLVQALKEQDDIICRMQEEVSRYQATLTELMNRVSSLEKSQQ